MVRLWRASVSSSAGPLWAAHDRAAPPRLRHAHPPPPVLLAPPAAGLRAGALPRPPYNGRVSAASYIQGEISCRAAVAAVDSTSSSAPAPAPATRSSCWSTTRRGCSTPTGEAPAAGLAATRSRAGGRAGRGPCRLRSVSVSCSGSALPAPRTPAWLNGRASDL